MQVLAVGRWVGRLLAFVGFLGLAVSAAQAARVALVIGNQNYTDLVSLQKSIGDATSFGELFEAKGFDRVTVRYDLTRQGIDEAIAGFIDAIQPGDTAVFIYSGHGWSDGTQNYLVGVDAPKKGSQEFLKRISVPIRNGANGIIDEMDARGATLKVAIIDACRDNPFQAEPGTKAIGLGRGLNSMSGQAPKGTFLVFSAGAGQTALDRLSDVDPDPNGLFTRTFLPLLARDMTLLDATKAAQETVFDIASTIGYEQQPAFYDETRGNKACLSNSCSAPSPVTKPDEDAWASIAGSTDPTDFKSFIRFFPGSARRPEAEARLAALTPVVEPARPAVRDSAPASVATTIVTRVQDELARLGCLVGSTGGFWGPRSQAALDDYAAHAGVDVANLSPDAALLARLRAEPGGDCSAPASPTVIAALQDELVRLGCLAGNTGGFWGPRSQLALREYANRNGLDVATLTLDDQLLTRLRAEPADICLRLPDETIATVPGTTKALLLEASSDGSTNAVPFAGTVKWSKDKDETGLPVIMAKASIPARGLAVSFSIRKNVDPSLPASHLFEINFTVADSFVGKSIAGLPGVLLKNEELVPGTALIGASARVVGNSFLFALTAAPDDVKANSDLLATQKWIDLAVIYATGKRAIITLQKDADADTLFAELFAGQSDTASVPAAAYVRLSSQPSLADAQASLRTMEARWGDLFQGRSLEIQRADLGAKGIWYRVQLPTSGFADATAVCAQIKAAGGDCFATN